MNNPRANILRRRRCQDADPLSEGPSCKILKTEDVCVKEEPLDVDEIEVRPDKVLEINGGSEEAWSYLPLEPQVEISEIDQVIKTEIADENELDSSEIQDKKCARNLAKEGLRKVVYVIRTDEGGHQSVYPLTTLSPRDRIVIQDQSNPPPAVTLKRVTKDSPEMKETAKTEKFNCQSCRFTSTVKAEMEKHIFDMHLPKATLRCKRCDFMTFLQESMKQHLRDTHQVNVEVIKPNPNRKPGDTRRYQCRACKNIFMGLLNLKEHMVGCRSANKKNMLHCLHKHCGFTTAVHEELRLHSISRHKAMPYYRDGERYCCDQCDFKSEYEKTLTDHKQSAHAKEFQCPFCLFSSDHKTSLDGHVKAVHNQNYILFKHNEKKMAKMQCTKLPNVLTYLVK